MTEDTRDSIKMDDKQDKDRDPSIRIDDKYQDPSKKIEHRSVLDQDPSISIHRNRDKDQDGGLNVVKFRLISDGDWRSRKKTNTGHRRRSDSDRQKDRHGQDRVSWYTR